MIACLIAAAALDITSWMAQEKIDVTCVTNKAARSEVYRRYAEYRKSVPRRKERTDLTPAEAFHRFVNGDRVKLQGDLRPKDYKSVAPDPKKRPPRKEVKK